VTGLPATVVDHGQLLSKRIMKLRGKVTEARRRWNSFLPSCRHGTCEFAFPDEIDLMGRTRGQTSLRAVVHVDGNSIGDSIRMWLNRCIEGPVEDDRVRREYREWSQALTDCGNAVLKCLAERVGDSVTRPVNSSAYVLDGTPPHLSFPLDCLDHISEDSNGCTVFLPLIPVLLGGDDLTFLCHGRIGLDLAVAALREFERAGVGIPHLGDEGGKLHLTACAGVALVKAHAPFHRSYELAESLCRSAKEKRRKSIKESGGPSGSWLDWHVGSNRPGESIMELRHRQYQPHSHQLTLRPYPLESRDREVRTWTWLDLKLLGPGDTHSTFKQGFRGDDLWLRSRNKVKRLASLAVEGPQAVQNQMQSWRVVEPNISLPGGFEGRGFNDNISASLLDCIELMDLHLRLGPRNINDEEAASASPKTNDHEEARSHDK